MLQYSRKAFPNRVTSEDKAKPFKLYDHIRARHSESENRLEAQEKIRACGLTQLGSKGLIDDYGDLKQLLVGFLGVKPIDVLKEAGRRVSISMKVPRDSTWTVNFLLPTETNHLTSLGVVNGQIFPVRYPGPNGHIAHVSVKLLRFPVEDVSWLCHFLDWSSRGDIYLSERIKEADSFHSGGARPVLKSDRQSQADSETFSEVLKNAEIREADGISSDLRLHQHDKLYIVEGKRATIHIDEGLSGLKVYLPRKKKDQGYVFAMSSELEPPIAPSLVAHPTNFGANENSAIISEDF
ncbi:hypothetical protein M406DRAFT_73631 [Cryphonectria parasitica EP155]|uniref:Uncharacterized protein n=1 Tax=Cryphonectria parasitica (strain ATCC 38755 / EP155) TaxID=660469 RepID=A0A9P5CKP9_CRYP1|nr:uncharacterized protein M406DRAFT_73631 [Cryphonectria parasitica EP155]KAF3761196.1 hypothetical protein M406DRAFT_73631 [Cryphonectria parasitica EP155]